MAERSTITQSVQVGVETAPGTPAAANKRLGSIGFNIGPQTETATQRPIGQKYASLNVLGKEWSEADIEGSPVYSELQYLFASLVNAPTVSQIMDGSTQTGAYRWVFESNTFGDDAPKTLTLEQGSSFRAHRVTHGLISELGFNFDREECTLEGTLIARALEDGITMTATPAGFPQIPIRPTDISVYLDNVSGDLGNTKQERTLSGGWSLGSRFEPLWVVDRDQPSFVSTVEGEPELEFTLTQMADAQAMENLLAMRGGTSRFLRIEALGPVIYTPGSGDPIRYSMVIDCAGQITEVGSFDDEDGVYAVEWTFGGVHDSTWGKAFRIEVVNTAASL